MSRPGLLQTVVFVLGKDLQIEWRTRARLNALLFFAVATLLLFSFALGSEVHTMRQSAPGFLWLAIFFSSVLSLSESFRIETENLALDSMRLVPTDPRAIFLGKALGSTLLCWLLAMALVPLTIALFDVHPEGGVGALAGAILLGSLAISAPGTVYGAIASNARARDVLLPLLMFPVLIPALIGSVKATSLIIEGDPMNQLGSWVLFLIVFNVVYWAVGFLVFPRVIEDD